MQNTHADERKNSKVAPLTLSHFLYGKQMFEDTLQAMDKRKEAPFDFNIYGMGRTAMIAESIK